jgi:hypothetical protein
MFSVFLGGEGPQHYIYTIRWSAGKSIWEPLPYTILNKNYLIYVNFQAIDYIRPQQKFKYDK